MLEMVHQLHLQMLLLLYRALSVHTYQLSQLQQLHRGIITPRLILSMMYGLEQLEQRRYSQLRILSQ